MSDTHTLYQQLREHLHTLGLTAAADRLAPALETAEREKPGYTEFLHDMLTAEVAALHQRRLAGRLRFAKLPARKTLEQFDFTAQPELDRRLTDDLATLRFIEEKANVLLIGPPGVGKTMLATALGYNAVQAGYRVYYTTTADLVARTTKAAIEGRWETTMRFWERAAGANHRRARLPPDARRSRLTPVPGHNPPLRARLDHPDHQPAHRRLGPDLRRHHPRDRDPRPAPTPLHRRPNQRPQLSHARPPRRHPRAPTSDHRWGKTVITPGEFA